MEKNLILIQRSADNLEVIHNFRVAYKKTRALIRLCHTGDSGKAVKIPTELGDIYDRAGKVRRLQLYYYSLLPYLSKSNRLPPGILKNIEQLRHQLNRAISKLNIRKVMRSITSEAPKRMSGKILKKFIRRKIKTVKRILRQPVTSDRKLHTVRKGLKDILYISNFFSLSLYKRLAAIGIQDEKELRGFTDLLNDHRDYIDALNILGNTPFANISDQNRTLLYGIRRHWEQSKRLLALRIQNRRVLS